MTRKEEEEGAKIAIKKAVKVKGKTSGRQTKLPVTGKNNLQHTKPSHFAEAIDPLIPEYNANPKKPTAVRTKKRKEEVHGEEEHDDESEGEQISESNEKPKKPTAVRTKKRKEEVRGEEEHDDKSEGGQIPESNEKLKKPTAVRAKKRKEEVRGEDEHSDSNEVEYIPKYENSKKPAAVPTKKQKGVARAKDEGKAKGAKVTEEVHKERIAAARAIVDSFNFSSDEDEDVSVDLLSRLTSKKTNKAVGAKKRKQKQSVINFKPKKRAATDSEEESGSFDEMKVPSPKVPRPSRARAAPVTYVEERWSSDEEEVIEIDDDSDSDEDFMSVPVKRAKRIIESD